MIVHLILIYRSHATQHKHFSYAKHADSNAIIFHCLESCLHLASISIPWHYPSARDPLRARQRDAHTIHARRSLEALNLTHGQIMPCDKMLCGSMGGFIEHAARMISRRSHENNIQNIIISTFYAAYTIHESWKHTGKATAPTEPACATKRRREEYASIKVILIWANYLEEWTERTHLRTATNGVSICLKHQTYNYSFSAVNYFGVLSLLTGSINRALSICVLCRFDGCIHFSFASVSGIECNQASWISGDTFLCTFVDTKCPSGSNGNGDHAQSQTIPQQLAEQAQWKRWGVAT